MAITLGDLLSVPRGGWISDLSEFRRFAAHPRIACLNWPHDVVRQWLWEHGSREEFLVDYGQLDLAAVHWSLELLPARLLATLPTGPSDGNCIEAFAAHPEHWVGIRSVHVREGWDKRGTWIVPPVLLDATLLSDRGGLQVVEGRTRVGVLRGRLRNGSYVADRLEAWVGRHAHQPTLIATPEPQAGPDS